MPDKTERPRCPYCGRRIARNRRSYVRAHYFADGSSFIGHRSCFMEMTHPDDPRFGHARHDIKEGR